MPRSDAWSSSRRLIPSLIVAIGVAGFDRPASAVETGSLSGIRFLSPVPGSCLHLPETNVIVGLDHALARGAGGVATAIVATGSRSGHHAGRTIVSNDGRTVWFEPDQPFAYGEVVGVELRPPLTTAGTGSPALSFTITRRRLMLH